MNTASPEAPSAAELLRRYGLHAKKSWGQNFLCDERVLRTIAAACAVGPGDAVVEIGAGLGALTGHLLGSGAEVYAVERDRDMCHVLRSEFAAAPRFHLLEENALRPDLLALLDPAPAPEAPLVVAGNLPYHLAAQLLFQFLSPPDPRLRRLVFMVQKEVGDRVLAEPDTEHYSALSVQLQQLASVRRVCHVGPGAFLPPPRVHSSVLCLTPRPAPLHPVQSPERFRAAVRAAFNQRRKTLRRALAAVFGDQAVKDACAAAAIDSRRRGETLSIAEFARLADALPEPHA